MCRPSARIFLVCFLAASSLLVSAKPSIVGEAYSVDGNELLYTEYHKQIKPHLWQVEYVSQAGETIAEKTVDYSQSLACPDFVLKNHWSQQKAAVSLKRELENSKAAVEVMFGPLKAGQEKRKQKTLEDSNLVVDAGFDHYVRQRWGDLVAGKAVEYNFVVPPRLTTLAMQTQTIDCTEPLLQKLEVQAQATICMRTVASNVLLRLAIPSIHLVYDRQTQDLLRFRGLGNIADQSGEMLEVDIRYTYAH